MVKVLEAIAPTSQAESWDNVGLLLEPSSPQTIKRIAITNDLTEEVLEEILELWSGEGQGLVISYHPPIFKPLKRLTQSSSKERVLVMAMKAGLAIYSPHTALDNIEGGINDWLLGGVGEGEVVALGVHKHLIPFSNSVEVKYLREDDKEQLQKVVGEGSGVDLVHTSGMYVNICVLIRCCKPHLDMPSHKGIIYNLLYLFVYAVVVLW